jgi:hypothetical protein
MAMREYDTYDMYGLLQGLLEALGKHVSAIPLQVCVELAKSIVEALPTNPEDVHVEVAPRITQRERYKQHANQNEPTATPPTLSPFGAFIAH